MSNYRNKIDWTTYIKVTVMTHAWLDRPKSGTIAKALQWSSAFINIIFKFWFEFFEGVQRSKPPNPTNP